MIAKKTAADAFVLGSLAIALYIFFVPIEVLHEDGLVRNMAAPSVILSALSIHVFMFYDFAVRQKTDSYRGLWFFSFLLLIYFSGLLYYFIIYRRNLR